MDTLEQIAAFAHEHGFTAYVDGAAVYVFVPAEPGITDLFNEAPDDVCECRTMDDLYSVLYA